MSEELKSFKVNDRRRFDEEGNDRELFPVDKETPSSPSSLAPNTSPQGSVESSTSRGPDFVMKDESNPRNDPSQDPSAFNAEHGGMLSFSSFLMSLATQALMQMGEMEPPGGIRLPPDFDAAKQTIEVIGMLAIKTKGNLDPEEQRLLAEVLHSIRLTFVQRVKAAMSASGPASNTPQTDPAAGRRPLHK